MIRIGEYTYKNEQDVIHTFKELLKPEYGLKGFQYYSNSHEIEFQEIIKWLHKNKYTIKEFPNAIQQEDSLVSLGYNQMRNYIMKEKNITGKVSWSDRRQLSDSLTIQKTDLNSNFIPESDINDVLNNIALDNEDFSTKTKDEKINLLNNCIEYLLKDNGKYITIDENKFFGFFDTSSVKKYRNDTQVFRHNSKESLDERNSWTDNKKDFYIKLGIILVIQISQQNKISDTTLPF